MNKYINRRSSVYTSSVFTYTQKQTVVLLTGNSPRKYMPQYAKPLTLNKGVDNRIQFQLLNQEQKPVDITDKVLTFRLLNAEGTKILLDKALRLTLPLKGIAVLELNAADIEDIPAQRAHYSLEIPEGEFDFPIFVDQDAGARGDMYIVDSVLPSFVASQVITIPQSQSFPNSVSSGSESYGLTEYTYYSSVINTQDNPILTIQAKFNEFEGNVVIEGSTEVDSDWYEITTETYANTSDTFGYTIKGYHPFVRMSFVSDSGEVEKILAR